jgi:hypothetical protein
MKNNEVVVINKNPKPFTDGFAGITYTFETNKKVSIPLEAAVHIFGLNKEDKIPTLRRLGLANHPDGKEWLNNIKMTYVEYVPKSDEEEIEKLKIELEAKQAAIGELEKDLDGAKAEIEQLKEQLEKASKTAKKA